MHYDEFINAVSRNRTTNIRSLHIRGNSSPDAIPSQFTALIPEVVQIMDKNFSALSHGDPLIGIFGIQIAGIAINSIVPILKNRIFHPTITTQHLCCSLYFMTIKSVDKVRSWGKHESIIVDFTKGVVMDGEQYLHQTVDAKTTGKIFGRLDTRTLDNVWLRYMKEIIIKNEQSKTL